MPDTKLHTGNKNNKTILNPMGLTVLLKKKVLGKCQTEELTINAFLNEGKDMKGIPIPVLGYQVRLQSLRADPGRPSRVSQKRGESELAIQQKKQETHRPQK